MTEPTKPTNPLDALLAQAQATQPRTPGDHTGPDGLLRCGACGRPKQCVIENWQGTGQPRTVPCDCGCAAAHAQTLQTHLEAQERRRLVEKLRGTGFPDEQMRRWTFGADDGANPKAMDVARRYVEKFPEMKARHTGLLVYGDVGCGKSFMAACVANALIDRGVPALMTNFGRVINELQGTFDGRQRYLDGLNAYDLLVIDDLGAERDTDWMWEQVMNVVDGRYRSGKPLLVTTNLTERDLADCPDIRKRRVYSRLKEMCVPLRMEGADRRNRKMRSNVLEARGLLGL